MTLSHRMLGQLVGARRPTVSTSLAELVREGEVARRSDGTWLLTGAPVGVPAAEIERVIPLRRRLLPPDPPSRSDRPPAEVIALPDRSQPADHRSDELTAAIQRVREQCEIRLAELREVFVDELRLAESTSELRERCRATRGAAEPRQASPAAGA